MATTNGTVNRRRTLASRAAYHCWYSFSSRQRTNEKSISSHVLFKEDSPCSRQCLQFLRNTLSAVSWSSDSMKWTKPYQTTASQKIAARANTGIIPVCRSWHHMAAGMKAVKCHPGAISVACPANSLVLTPIKQQGQQRKVKEAEETMEKGGRKEKNNKNKSRMIIR